VVRLLLLPCIGEENKEDKRHTHFTIHKKKKTNKQKRHKAKSPSKNHQPHRFAPWNSCLCPPSLGQKEGGKETKKTKETKPKKQRSAEEEMVCGGGR